MSEDKTIHELKQELRELRHQLFEATETIEAIRTGQVDALVVEHDDGHQLYTLKTADQAYRVFIETMNEGAVTLNYDGVILYCNSRFAEMVNRPLSATIGKQFSDFLTAGAEGIYDALLIKSREKEYKEETILVSGSYSIPVQMSFTTFELEGRLAVSIILTDLSTQKRIQQELVDKNAELAQTNQALEVSNHDLQQFASVASHDLQEPLRKILIFTNLLLEKPNTGAVTNPDKYLAKILHSAVRMKALVVDVLNYSRLSAKNNSVELLNLNLVITELLEDFELLVKEKEAVLQVMPLPPITANRGQMRQVFQNIISNSLKFAKADTPLQILISGRRLAAKSFDSPAQEDGPYVEISIRDNGIGFDEKYLSQIFTLFERLHSKDSYEGTGIGLAITKKIVDKHNGIVSARSNGESGAEFIIILPVGQ